MLVYVLVKWLVVIPCGPAVFGVMRAGIRVRMLVLVLVRVCELLAVVVTMTMVVGLRLLLLRLGFFWLVLCVLATVW